MQASTKRIITRFSNMGLLYHNLTYIATISCYNREMSPKLQEKFLNTGKPPSAFTFTTRMIPCGKKGCMRCPHGPYWYAVHRVGPKVKSIYIGRVLPEELKFLVST